MYLFITILLLWLAMSFACRRGNLKPFSVEALLPLRGVLALFIVIHHCALRIDCVAPDAPWMLRQFSFMGAPVVAVFFFLSGYGLTRSLRSKGAGYLQGFLHKRLSKIIIPLLICSAVYSLADVALLGGGFPSIKIDWPFLPNCWFCVTIAVYYLAFYVSAKFSQGRMVRLLLAMLLFSVVYIALLKTLDFRNWWLQTPIALNVGMLVACYEQRMRRLLESYVHAVAVVLFVALAGSAYLSACGDILGLPLGFMLLSVLIGIFIYAMVCRLPLPGNRALSFLGRYSYEIYLVHGAIISVLFGRGYTYIADLWPVFTLATLLSALASAVVLRKIVSYIRW